MLQINFIYLFISFLSINLQYTNHRFSTIIVLTPKYSTIDQVDDECFEKNTPPN